MEKDNLLSLAQMLKSKSNYDVDLALEILKETHVFISHEGDVPYYRALRRVQKALLQKLDEYTPRRRQLREEFNFVSVYIAQLCNVYKNKFSETFIKNDRAGENRGYASGEMPGTII